MRLDSTMMRAFLSHASVDKPFVEEVASRLGRYQARIDSRTFDPGEDFRSEIRRVMDESEAFVLFVSPESLASNWVQFEIDEAEIRTMRRLLHRSLAIFIDGPVIAEELPAWLQRVRAVQRSTPGQAARSVEALLLRADPQSERPLFGRSEDLQRAQRKIGGDDPRPRVLVASGLEGIGRRSYLAKLVRDSLSLDLGPTFRMEASDTLEDLYMASRSSSSMLTRAEVEREILSFRGLSVREQSEEVAKQLIFLADDGTAPCIVDRGAMLAADGTYREEFADLISDFVTERDVYLCIAHMRAPDLRGLRVRWAVYARRLEPLAPQDSQAFVTKLLLDANRPAEPEQIATLAAATNGYPPAAVFLAADVETYGVDVVLADPGRLTDFNTRAFARFIQSLNLSQVERDVLVFLASETGMPLAGIATAVGHRLEPVAQAIARLVDLSILDVNGSEYAVTSPIQDTVRRVHDGFGRRWYEEAFKRLEAEYWSDERSLPSISIVDATLRAGLRVGLRTAEGYSAFVRPSILVNAAQEMYHRREFALALEYLDRAEAMGRGTPQLDELKIKSLAQLGRIGEARAALREYRNHGERRQWYLEGFVDRKAGQHVQAATAFQRGYAAGDRTTSLLRDYADSLLRTDALDDAAVMAREALSRSPGNVYVNDLVARIEIDTGTTEDAESAVSSLGSVDVERQFWPQRQAEFLMYRRGNAEAIRRAISVCEEAASRRQASADLLIVLARALIRARNWDRLDEIKESLRRRRDVDSPSVLGRLDLEAAIRQGQWRRAERYLPDQLRSAEDRALAAAVYELKGDDASVMREDRQEAKKRASALVEPDSGRKPVPISAHLYE